MNQGRGSRSKPLRADAERNRQSIICAGARVLAEEGTAVTLEHIAEVAGVGTGTIYRRFACLDELVAVVMEDKITRYADRSEQAAARAATDPWGAFEDHVFFMLEQQATDVAFSELILSPRAGTAHFHDEIRRSFDASLVLIDRVKAAGMIRDDFHHSDLYLLLNANAGIVHGLGHRAPDSWRRFGHLMLQAFRHPGDATLPQPPQSWVRPGHPRDESAGPPPT
ncbi:MAG: TetR/AcrR family transcriptional regulator [Arachnia sp.]